MSSIAMVHCSPFKHSEFSGFPPTDTAASVLGPTIRLKVTRKLTNLSPLVNRQSLTFIRYFPATGSLAKSWVRGLLELLAIGRIVQSDSLPIISILESGSRRSLAMIHGHIRRILSDLQVNRRTEKSEKTGNPCQGSVWQSCSAFGSALKNPIWNLSNLKVLS